MSSGSPPVASAAVSTISPKDVLPQWLGPLLQGVTLAAVFAVGAWTGKIDNKVDDVLHQQEQQRTDLKDLSEQVAKLNNNLSYLQGVLATGGDAKPRRSIPSTPPR